MKKYAVILMSLILLICVYNPIVLHADELNTNNSIEEYSIQSSMESQDFGLTNDEKVASAELGVESLEIRPENAEVLEESVAEEEVAIQDHSPNSEVSDKNSEEPAEIEDVSFEEYLNNVADFRKVSIEEVRRSFENDQLEHTLYFGRGTCYHCRVFSPELKIFNQLIDGNLEYYDIDGADFGEEAKDFLFRVVGIPGTPALLRMYNGKPLAAWVGGGITAQQLYNHLYATKIENHDQSNEQSDTEFENERENSKGSILITQNIEKEKTLDVDTRVTKIQDGFDDRVRIRPLSAKEERIEVHESSNHRLPNTSGHGNLFLMIFGFLFSYLGFKVVQFKSRANKII
ncbi:thioredoxin family protein [Streptococcus sp. NLN76]|uniref:thioredoxin family protein n=2 Tax=unclassified Streptococcus TaxID=2608887 RepID=UPI0018A8B1A3|nr:thioredoxin family protein [Streptococcus sp. NLN76]MBF8971120.1 hypothetical protein [Streptococcus sp. NLN76]